MATTSSSKTVVYAALAGNLLVALTKFAAAWWTGSSAMLSEGVHSLVDTTQPGAAALWHAPRREPPDEQHPLGYGRELYFWSFIVALLMFTLGAGVTLLRRRHCTSCHPVPIVDAYGELHRARAARRVFEGATWLIALREFRKAKGDARLFRGGAAQQGPADLHGPVRGQRRARRVCIIASSARFAAQCISACRRSTVLRRSASAAVLGVTALACWRGRARAC